MGVPPGIDGMWHGMWNEQEQVAGQKKGPVLIPMPVPVPVPLGCADASAAMNAFMATAAGQDMYSAFFSSAGYPHVPQTAPNPRSVQPPPGFIAPPGFKLVPAPGPMQDMPNMPSYPGSWPAMNMNEGRTDFTHERQDVAPDLEKKRPTKTSASSNADLGKVFIGGLSPATTVDMLRDHFSKFGQLGSVS